MLKEKVVSEYQSRRTGTGNRLESVPKASAAVQAPHTSVTWEHITVDQAMIYLESSNRRIRQNHVNYLAAQMKAGHWRETHQGIAFHANGSLIDGHHRLWAMVECDIELNFYVTRGMTDDDVLAIDKGMGRNFEDDSHYQNWGVEPLGPGVAKAVVLGPTVTTKLPSEVLYAWYEFHKESIEFALLLRLTSRPSVGKSFTIWMAAAIARAHASGADPAMLERFCAILKTGQVPYEADRAAFTLREAWLQGRLGRASSEQYFKTESALRAFLERRTMKTIKRAEGELFKVKPLPDSLKFNTWQASNSPRSGKSVRARVAKGGSAQ